MGIFAFDLIREFELVQNGQCFGLSEAHFRHDYDGAHDCTYYSGPKIGKNKATQEAWLGSIKDWRSRIPGI